MPTLLIQALLEGPTDPRVERTFVPEGTSLNLSVTVSPDGIADIPLAGDLSELPLETLEKMEVQFAWTLRQVPSISEIRITVGGHPLPLPGGTTEFSVYTGANYDPAGTYARGEIYGLSDGLAVRVLDGEAQTRLRGPFGQRQYGLRDVSVDLDASQIAGVTKDGQRVILSSVAGTDELAPRTVLSGGVDILHPAWDISHRMWVVDRRPAGAVVSVVVNDRVAAVDVPGITGQDVIDFLVSRDGTRIVAAIRGRGSDRIVMSRTFTAGPKSTLHATRRPDDRRGEERAAADPRHRLACADRDLLPQGPGRQAVRASQRHRRRFARPVRPGRRFGHPRRSRREGDQLAAARGASLPPEAAPEASSRSSPAARRSRRTRRPCTTWADLHRPVARPCVAGSHPLP